MYIFNKKFHFRYKGISFLNYLDCTISPILFLKCLRYFNYLYMLIYCFQCLLLFLDYTYYNNLIQLIYNITHLIIICFNVFDLFYFCIRLYFLIFKILKAIYKYQFYYHCCLCILSFSNYTSYNNLLQFIYNITHFINFYLNAYAFFLPSLILYFLIFNILNAVCKYKFYYQLFVSKTHLIMDYNDLYLYYHSIRIHLPKNIFSIKWKSCFIKSIIYFLNDKLLLVVYICEYQQKLIYFHYG